MGKALCKHEDPSLEQWNLHKSGTWRCAPVTPSLGVCWPASLAETVPSMLDERLCLKNYGEETIEVDILMPWHLCDPQGKCNTHTTDIESF